MFHPHLTQPKPLRMGELNCMVFNLKGLKSIFKHEIPGAQRFGKPTNHQSLESPITKTRNP